MAPMPEVVLTPPAFNRLPDMTKPDFLWADRFGCGYREGAAKEQDDMQ
jgi:hypothetical protein